MNSVFDQAQRFAEIWTDFASKMATAGMPYDPEATPTDTAQRVRQALFQAMAQYADDFMRSPQFLELSRQSMDAAINFRQQFNDALTAMHHNLQGIARQDVDSIMLSLRHLEQRVLDTMEGVNARLDAIEKKLAALDAGGRAAASPRRRQVRHSSIPKMAKGPGVTDGKSERLAEHMDTVGSADDRRGDQQPAPNGPPSTDLAEGSAG